MITQAIIWRESMYKNGFKCNECGNPCATEKNGKVEILDDVLFDVHTDRLYCPKCGNYIAKMTIIDAPEEEHGKKIGYFDEYQKRKRMS